MRSQTIATGVGVLILIGVSVLIGRLSCPKPEDGNPIGIHIHGLAKTDNNPLRLSNCKQGCKGTLRFDIAIGKNNAAPQPSTKCPRNANCIHFVNATSQSMAISSVDDATPHPEESVNAEGTFEISP